MVENLVTNAQRHAVGAVVVTVEDGRLAVTDDGPGVPEADRQRIFEPFVSGDPSRSRELGGVGLGLSLAKAAVERWGGRLEVEEAQGGGARFTARWSR